MYFSESVRLNLEKVYLMKLSQKPAILHIQIAISKIQRLMIRLKKENLALTSSFIMISCS